MISNLLLWDWKCHGQLSWTVLFISVLAACFFWQQKFPAWTMYTLSYQSRPQLDRRIFVVVNTRHMQKDQQVASRVVQELWLSLGRSISRARWCEHNSIHKTHVPFGNQTWKLEIHYIYIISVCVYIYTVYEWRFSICFRSSDDMIDFPATFDDNEGYMQCAPEFDIALVTGKQGIAWMSSSVRVQDHLWPTWSMFVLVSIWRLPKMGYPNSWMVYNGKSY